LREDEGNRTADEFSRHGREALVLALRPAKLDRDVPALCKASFVQAAAKRGEQSCGRPFGQRAEISDHRHRRLLCARSERPSQRGRRPA
jgi:hypothetical protein